MLVLKAPYNAGNIKKREGLEKGPDAIEKATENFYLSEKGVLPVFEFKDILVDNGNIDESHAAIEKTVSSAHGFKALLGGDHSVTKSSFKGFAKGKENPGLIVFDAHPDLMESFGTHEDYLRELIESRVVKPENVILVGLRNWDKEEYKYIHEHKIKKFTMKEISMEGKEEVCNSFMAACKGFSDLYISVDIDVLDPSFAPGTGYCEPGGLSTRELLYFLQRMQNLNNIGMVDIVEVNPDLDLSDLTVNTAAKILVEFA